MSAVGKTQIGLRFNRISSHTPKNIQEGSAEIICEDIDILSHPSVWSLEGATKVCGVCSIPANNVFV